LSFWGGPPGSTQPTNRCRRFSKPGLDAYVRLLDLASRDAGISLGDLTKAAGAGHG